MTSSELGRAVDAAQRATLTLHALMALHGISGIEELKLMLQWPAGMLDAYRDWMASMVAVVNALGHSEGIQDMSALSAGDKVRLTVRAYDLVSDSPIGDGVRAQLSALTRTRP